MKELTEIQCKLIAPKNQYNSFGKYNYRSCEDILQGLKPHLNELKCTVKISDSVEMVGDRIYIKATATIKNSSGDEESVTAYAREPHMKKGMDEAQVTGSASSYARKYALNGLFAIDDSRDADYLNTDTGRKKATLFASIDKFSVSEFFGANNIDTFNACVYIAQFFKVEKVTLENLTNDQIKLVFDYQQYFVDTYQLG
jgi:hypothetical protein